jgi:hypothetical protein
MDSSWWLDKLRRLPEIVQEVTPWLDKETINTALLFVVVFLIERARRRLKRNLDDFLLTVNQKLSALRDDVESLPESFSDDEPHPPTAPPPDAGLQYWEQIRGQWADVRDRIDTNIAKLSASARRPYSQIKLGNYKTIIARLRQVDKAISEDTTQRLFKMSDIFYQNRPTASRTRRLTAEEYQKLYDAVIKELPKPPDGDGAE